MHLDRLSLQSESYASTGNIGENVRRLLGTPSSDRLETVVRESLQNIADAALPGLGPNVLIRIRSLEERQLSVLRDCVLRDLPKDNGSRGRFGFLKGRASAVLEICDFNTKGLGGPTRADRIPRDSATDFVDFVRNVGTPRDTPHGGGTYGFGKVSLYAVSRCNAILIDSLVAGGGTGSRRLIGSHLGPAFHIEKEQLLHRFTGRHWWGREDDTGELVEPVLDTQAEQLSSALGFVSRPSGRSGTSIMILDFDWPEEGLEQAGARLAEAALWNFWPRMMATTPDHRRLRLAIEVEGKPIDIPTPEIYPPLALFCEAMQDARAGTGPEVHEISCGRPVKHLGNLAIRRGLRVPRHPMTENESLVPDILQHIALMRPVELVVKYMKGSPLPNEHLEWAGVFLASSDDEVERAFADSEPPAHDDWIPASMDRGRARTFVNVAIRELSTYAHGQGSTPSISVEADSDGPPLARLAGQLGSLLHGQTGDGAGPSPSQTTNRKRPRTARVSEPEFGRLEMDEEGRIAVFKVRVRQDVQQSGIELRGSAAIALDGSASSDAEVYKVVPRPTVFRIRGIDTDLSCEGAVLPIAGAEGEFELFVRMPTEAAVAAHVQLTLREPG